jgi:hypothetical protein
MLEAVTYLDGSERCVTTMYRDGAALCHVRSFTPDAQTRAHGESVMPPCGEFAQLTGQIFVLGVPVGAGRLLFFRAVS